LTPKICVSILPKTSNEALKLIEKAEEEKADLIEVRLDRLDKYDKLADLASHGKTPKIATNKPISCRGGFSGTEAEQKQILLDAAKNGFEYVDADLSTSKLKDFISQASEHSAKTIVSFHNFDSILKPAELDNILEREIAAGAKVCKIVTTTQQVEDNLPLLNFVAAASKRAKVVSFAMGAHGKVSRLMSPLFGGFFTFAALERGSETAPGQMTIKEMKSAYELLGLK
jgi:3-dehydroquinate dehydratase type I